MSIALVLAEVFLVEIFERDLHRRKRHLSKIFSHCPYADLGREYSFVIRLIGDHHAEPVVDQILAKNYSFAYEVLLPHLVSITGVAAVTQNISVCFASSPSLQTFHLGLSARQRVKFCKYGYLSHVYFFVYYSYHSVLTSI